MTSILGLDFIGDKVHAALVEGGAASAKVTAAFSATWPKELSPANASELGTWLRQQLAQHKIRTNDAACCVGRGLAAFKTISLPDCPNEEVAGMVVFAVDEGGSAPQVVDFQPGPSTGGERKVTVATLSPRLVETLTAVLNAAGLACKRLEFRPYGLRFLADRLLGGENAKQQDLLIVPMADGMELSVWTGLQLETTRVVANGDAAGAARLPAEIRRTLVSFHAGNAGAAVSRISVLAEANSAYAKSLATYSDHPVSTLNPRERLQGLAETNAELGAVGIAWHALSGARPVIDFFNPKKPAPPSNRNRKMVLAGTAAAAILIACGFMFWNRKISELDSDIDQLKEQISSLNGELKKGEPDLALHKEMKTWLAGKVDWLDEFAELAECMPTTSDGFVERLRGNVAKGGEHNIDVNVRTRQQGSLVFFADQLSYLPGWEPVSLMAGQVPEATDFTNKDNINVTISPIDLNSKEKTAKKKLVVAKDPDGKRRRPIGQSMKQTAVMAAAASPRGGGSRRDPPAATQANGSPNPSPSASATPAPSSGETSLEDDLAKEVRRLAQMEYSEREKAIDAKPRILQRRFREAVKKELEKAK